MTDSDSTKDEFEEGVWELVSDGERNLLTREEMADSLFTVAKRLATDHFHGSDRA